MSQVGNRPSSLICQRRGKNVQDLGLHSVPMKSDGARKGVQSIRDPKRESPLTELFGGSQSGSQRVRRYHCRPYSPGNEDVISRLFRRAARIVPSRARHLFIRIDCGKSNRPVASCQMSMYVPTQTIHEMERNFFFGAFQSPKLV